MLDLRLYLLQRLSALVIAPLVLGHVATMVVAIQGGLTVAEILGRTQGSAFWFVYYMSFVAAVSVHGAIGLRVVAHEVLGLSGRALSVLMWVCGAALLLAGSRAVLAVSWP